MKTIHQFILNKQSIHFFFLPLFVFFLKISNVSAQEYTLRLKVQIPPKMAEAIYVAGNFNGWDPSNEKFKLVNINGESFVSIPGLKEDNYEFKFTRGNWDRVEVSSSGMGISNRLIKLISDTTIECIIENWQDNFALADKQHTASSHVHLLDSAFFIPQFNSTRRVWIYLPEGYAKAKNKKRYPVLYMNDGRNVFDEYTSGFGEWGVDECLDSLIKNGVPAAIVVAVDAGPARVNEYNPYPTEKYGKGLGARYVDFLAKVLKPYIDRHYRTLKNADNNIIAGSSLGGLISYYALLTHPGSFGKAGVFSPSFWIAPAIKQLTDSVGADINGKIFFYIGQEEGDSYVEDMKVIADSIGEKSDAIIYSVIDPQGHHNEQAWRKWFAEFYRWMMGDNFNSQIDIEK